MNVIELFLKDGRSADVWACGQCRTVAKTAITAETCCKPKLCACGKELKPHYIVCDGCHDAQLAERERERFERAEKVTEWNGPVFLADRGDRDGYFTDVDDFEDWWAENKEENPEEERPKYVWTCDAVPMVRADVGDMTERIEFPDGWDDSDLKGREEFAKACDAFNEANKELKLWEPNSKRALVLGK
jgi:hypothetical protein